MANIKEQPWAEWLEDGLKTILEKDCEQIGIVAKAKDGEILTGFYGCTSVDKAVFLGHMQAEIMLDVARENADLIRQAADEMEADGDGV